MSDNNKKLVITILNIVIMVVNAVIAYLSKDTTSIPIVAMGISGINTICMG